MGEERMWEGRDRVMWEVWEWEKWGGIGGWKKVLGGWRGIGVLIES